MRIKKKILRALTLLLCLSSLCLAAAAANESPTMQTEKYMCALAGCKTGELLENREWVMAGNSASDWLAIVFALNDVPEKYDAYLRALEEHVTEQYAKKGCLDTVLATEYHRIALTVLALGGDPTAFGKDADGRSVDLIADGTWKFGSNMSRQGLNGLIYALIALDAKGYETPADAAIDREWLIGQILDAQNEDGGFGFVKGTSDVDLSAMTLTALAPYREAHADEIEKTLSFLSGAQGEDGQFFCFGDANVESAAQVIIALCSLGTDPERDARFIKNGVTLPQVLEQYRLADGGYCHTLGDELDIIATEQTLLALTAIDRLRAGSPGIYDFTAGKPLRENSGNTAKIAVTAAVVVLVGTAAVLVTTKLRKRGKADANDHE